MSIERITITCTQYGQVCQNVFHLSNTDGFMTPAQIAAEVSNYWIGSGQMNVGISYWQPGDIRWISVQVQRVESPPPSPYILQINQPGAYGPEENRVPFASLIMRFRCAISDRKHRGRMYVPGIFSTGLKDGFVIFDYWSRPPLVLANLKNRFLFSSGSSGPLFLVINPKGNHPDPKTVTDITFAPTPGCQRRRGVNVGV